jgi:hypothetical protein
MIWAVLAAFLTKRPAWVQALVVGLCTGLFVATAAEANQREPLITTVVLLVLVAGAVAGTAFYLGLRAQNRHGWLAGTAAPAWVTAPGADTEDRCAVMTRCQGSPATRGRSSPRARAISTAARRFATASLV